MLCFPPHPSSASALPCEIGNPEDSALLHCAWNTVQLLQYYRVPFSWAMPDSPYGWTHWFQDVWSHTAAWVWVVSQKVENKQLVEYRQCTNTAFEGKMQFLRFSVLPGSAETQVVWCGIVNCLLIAYFIGNISAKNIKIRSHVSKVIASQRWDVFEARCTVTDRQTDHTPRYSVGNNRPHLRS